MIQDILDQLKSVHKKVQSLKTELANSQFKQNKYEEEYQKLLKEKSELEIKNKELEENCRLLKMTRVLEGDSSHTPLMKRQINKLIKDLDACIEELHSNEQL